MKKILLLYTSVGLGHKILAENLAYHLERQGYEVRLHDFYKVHEGAFVRVGTIVHQFINVRLPFIWGWIYRWMHYAAYPFRLFIAKFNADTVWPIIESFRPDMIISTQTAPSAVIAYLKQKGLYRGLFGIAFHDYHLHPYWIYRQADFYLAIIDEQKEQMVKAGHNADAIFICGMTLQPRPEIDRTAVKARLAVNPDYKVILLASGSLGTQMAPQWVEQLQDNLERVAKQKNIAIKFIVCCGRNQELYENLRKSLSGRAIVLGYHQPMAELLAVADIFLTKPGGLSIAEGLQWGLPMLITHWLPGQEKLNYEYLQKHALVMPGPFNPYTLKVEKIGEMVMQELAAGHFRATLAANQLAKKLPQFELPAPVVAAVAQMFHTRI